MRQTQAWNGGWQFRKPGEEWTAVTLPHTWNALDGQDGGDDYYRGKAEYRKAFTLEAVPHRVYLRFGAVSKKADVLVNGVPVCTHMGGFSAFTADITPALHAGENEVLVVADNSRELPCYPKNADFTFFGGMYRGVEWIAFDTDAHFDLLRFGTEPLFITPSADGTVHLTAYAVGADAAEAAVLDDAGNTAAEGTLTGKDGILTGTLTVSAPKLWNGVDAPVLYTARVRLPGDETSAAFGFRSFSLDAEKGFFLNGKPYPLHGVCRHQDREGMGWALTEREHLEDMALIRDIGANTIRLAHYQQSPFFYDLCDRNGMVVWAEVPFISVYEDDRAADENIRSQLRELITQNYNHPSICFWGIANELGIGGESENMLKMLRELNALAKELDPTRLTVMANVGMTMPESEQFHITDAAAYNEYNGWYEGTPEGHGPFFDERRAGLPGVPLAVSEYGADSVLSWHSAEPKCKDYTEEYQALVHEKAYADFEARPWIWATWLWNMFDFAADSRDEGGCKGRNNKGIVSYDRKTKKQAFYFYKACWSREPFAYICGKRFTRRHEDAVDVKVYANAHDVTLWVNGKEWGSMQGERVFVFPGVPLMQGLTELRVRTGLGAEDTLILEKVEKKPEEYTLVVQKDYSANVAQWFAAHTVTEKELVIREGYLSVDDPMELVYRYPEGYKAVQELIREPLSADHPAMAARMATGGAMSFRSIWNHISKLLPDDAIFLLNEHLNKIPKKDGD